jgi:major inositol transporter-like SP family MFS transporter
MVTINELMIVTGQMLAFAINALLDALIHDPQVWRLMLGVASIPVIALLIGMLVLPESPRWFALRDRFADSRRILDLSRSPGEADFEYKEITESATTARNERSHAWRDLKNNPWMRKLLWIGIGLAVVQQATGINTVNYYAPSILERSGLGVSAALVATVAVGVTSVLMTVLGIYLLGFIGRRRMLVIGFSGVVASQSILAVVFILPQSDFVSYTILAAMMLFVAFVQCFIGTCVWLLLSEIFPMAIRLRHGHRRFCPLDRQCRHLLPVPRPRGGLGLDRNLRCLRAGEHCLPGVRVKVRSRNEGPFSGRTRGALPHRQPARRRAAGSIRREGGGPVTFSASTTRPQ